MNKSITLFSGVAYVNLSSLSGVEFKIPATTHKYSFFEKVLNAFQEGSIALNLLGIDKINLDLFRDSMSFSPRSPLRRMLSLGGALVRTRFSNSSGVELLNALGKLKGPVMKIGQFLATIPGAIPPEYSEAFLSLQSQAPSMPKALVELRMTEELGEEWRKKFENFEDIPAASASLGQVHKAEGLACKLQYPGMDDVIESDLKTLKWILDLLYSWQKTIDASRILKELRAHLNEELNYLQEAQNIETFRTLFEGDSEVVVPKVDYARSTQKLLVMEWMKGASILNPDFSVSDRHHLAQTLFLAWYKPFYRYGVLHGDPHPGNYQVSTDLKIQLLDFGCIRHFPTVTRDAVRSLYEGLRDHNTPKIKDAYAGLGFKNFEIIDILNEWARLLFSPVLENKVRPIQPNFNGTLGWRTACSVYKKLKAAGGVCPPQEFVLMDRAAVGLGGVFMRLKVELNWHALFEEILYGDARLRRL